LRGLFTYDHLLLPPSIFFRYSAPKKGALTGELTGGLTAMLTGLLSVMQTDVLSVALTVPLTARRGC
jgi:hypothetical protein